MQAQMPIYKQDHPLLKPLLLVENQGLSKENLNKFKNSGFECDRDFY